MRAGLFSNGVRLLPPLIMPDDMLREGLARSAGAIDVDATCGRTAASAVNPDARRRPP